MVKSLPLVPLAMAFLLRGAICPADERCEIRFDDKGLAGIVRSEERRVGKECS
jgi:hypothetical protein